MRILLGLGALTLLATLLGCGGSSPKPTAGTPPGQTGTGSVRFAVEWPTDGAKGARYIPPATKSIELNLFQNDVLVRTGTLIRQPGDTIGMTTIAGLKPGHTAIKALAYDANHVIRARGNTSVIVESGKYVQATIKMQAPPMAWIYEKTFGTKGSADGQTQEPGYLAWSRTDNLLYVADCSNNRIQMFDSDGTFIRKISVGSIHDVCVDRSGNIYGLTINGSVKKFTGDGTLLSSFTTSDASWGFALDDSNGIIYIAAVDQNIVKSFTTMGIAISSWQVTPATGGWQATDVTLDPTGSVLVASHADACVLVFTPDGTFLQQWGSRGTGDAQFTCVAQVTVKDPYVFITDHEGDRILVFSLDGEYICQFGSGMHGDGPDQFGCAHGVAIDEDWNVYVSDYWFDRILKYVPTDTPPAVTRRPTTLAQQHALHRDCPCHALFERAARR